MGKRTLMIAATLFLFYVAMEAQKVDYEVIPKPQKVETVYSKKFELRSGMSVVVMDGSDGARRTAELLCQYVKEQTGIDLHVGEKGDPSMGIVLLLKDNPSVSSTVDGYDRGGYTIGVSRGGIEITSPTDEGLFHGVQTLRKSIPIVKGGCHSLEFPYTWIMDGPRFPYRGVHLDSSRHFWSVETIKKYLDLLALHGCNQFHWHLTDDQGWRFEVKALPDLARLGSVREQTVIGRNSGVYDGVKYGKGFYYTQADCREIVRYASERYINVIPEIDMPGHNQSALHVYPELGCTGGPYPVWQQWGVSDDVLCAGNPATLDFLKTVFGELCDVFPSKLIHIGGDECPKVRWKECSRCQAKIRGLGIVDDGVHSVENQLQSYVNREIESYLQQRGREIIGWDETLEGGLTENSTVMSWRGTQGGIDAAHMNHDVIMTPVDYCYIDYYQVKNSWNAPLSIGGYVPASKTYSFEPVPEELNEDERKHILGAQVNLWCEYIAHVPHLFYMLLPRLDAISEVQWCQPEQKSFEDFKRRLDRMFEIYDLMGAEYCRTVE